MKPIIDREGSVLDALHILSSSPTTKKGRKHLEYTRSEVTGRKRALSLYCLGSSGTRDLKMVKSIDLKEPIAVVIGAFERGVELDAVQCGIARHDLRRRSANLSPKTIYRLRCTLLRFRSDCYGEELGEQGSKDHPSATEFREQKPKLPRKAKRSGRGQWPPGLLEEWALYGEYRCDEYYSGPGIAYRKQIIDRKTLMADQDRFNQLVQFCLTEEKMTDIALTDLVNYPRVLRYSRHYFSQRSKGGYTSFGHTCVQLAVMSRYLCAAGRLRNPEEPEQKYPFLPDSKSGQSLWGQFYRLKASTRASGSKSGKIVKAYTISGMEPNDLLDLGVAAWDSQPRMRESISRLSARQYMIYLRKRAAMFFILAPFMPLRARNWMEMCWDRNLRRDSQGIWTVHFEGKELKVPMRNGELNIYDHALSAQASAWIDRWRVELTAWIPTGEERLEDVVTNVFPERKNRLVNGVRQWGRTQYSGFSTAINALTIDLKGHPFPPHQIRHIGVAQFYGRS